MSDKLRQRSAVRIRPIAVGLLTLATTAATVASAPVATSSATPPPAAAWSGASSTALAMQAGAAAEAEPQRRATRQLRYWRAFQFNFCGAAEGRQLCGIEGRNGRFVRSLQTKIVDFRPHVVTLNEICRTQFNNLRHRLKLSGWAMRGTFVTTHSARTLSCSDNQHGNALLTRGLWWHRAVDCLSGCGRSKQRVEHRVGMCVTTRLRVKTRVCVVHVGTTRPERQIQDFIAEPNRVSRRLPVLIGGDFNREPGYDAMDPVYHAGGRGAFGNFQEADACVRRATQTRLCNESTRIERKIDFVFLAHRWFKNDDADAGGSRFSDHDPLRARFQQCAKKVC